jgi:hypothetical protein
MKKIMFMLVALLSVSVLSAGDSYWIWGADKVADGVSRTYLRLAVNVDDDVLSAEFFTIVDDAMEIYVNGSKPVPLSFFDQKPARIKIRRYEFKDLLKKGKNQLAIIVINKGGPGGIIGKGSIKLANGKVIDLATNEQWKAICAYLPGGNWKVAAFNDKAWKGACKLGDASLKPWSAMSDAVNFFGLPGGKK